MRELTKQELLMVGGGLLPVDAMNDPSQGAQSYATTATCYPLVTGAAQIGGTIGAIGAVAVTKVPAAAMIGFDAGAAVSSLAVGFACEAYMSMGSPPSLR